MIDTAVQPRLWKLLAYLLVAVWSLSLAALSAQAKRLNDTGSTQCRDEVTGQLTLCAGSGQDGESGRDVLAPQPRDGAAGFRFLKLGDAGQALPANATQWSCVQDRVTGLIWEIKTNDGRLRDMNSRYSNFADGRAFDASAFAQAVNALGLCGARDWRLPNHLELHSLMNLGVRPPGPTIDLSWFPNSPSGAYWSSTGVADYPGEAWAGATVSGHVTGGGSRGNRLFVRLVRSDPVLALPAPKARRDEVILPGWATTWQRCSVGQTWSAGQCLGEPSLMTWTQALAFSKAQAAVSGKPWRLPNVKELLSLIEPTLQQPAINRAAFPGTAAQRYWTSTPLAGSAVDVWTVDFAFGGSDLRHQDTALPLRLVLTRP